MAGGGITATNRSVIRGQQLLASDLFDLAGGNFSSFQLWDSTPDAGSGYWVVDGVAQGAGAAINVSASQLALTTFQSGSGTDQLWVRAYDGTQWGDWIEFHVAAPIDQAPIVTVFDSSTPANPNQTFLASDLFSASDAGGDAITRYELWDSDGNGHWIVDGGVETNGHRIDISADELANTVYHAGFGTDHLYVRAYDGIAWGDWTPAFAVVASADRAPVVTASQRNTTATHNQIFADASLFAAADADGDAMTRYALWDTEGNGHWVVNGLALAAGTEIDVAAANLAQISYVAGEGTDNLYVRADDGAAWGAWTRFTITGPADHAPVVTSGGFMVIAAGNLATSTAASILFNFSDPDGDLITKYQLWDTTFGPGSSHWVVNGVAQPNQTTVDITADQLANTTFHPIDQFQGYRSTEDTEWVRAFDGEQWSAWSSFQIIEPSENALPYPDAPPVVTVANVSAAHGQNIAASDLFSATDSDLDPIGRYEVWDLTSAANSGHWVLNGVATQSNVAIEVTAEQLADTSFQTGSGSDDLWVRAYDGVRWSTWREFYADAPADQLAVTTAADFDTLPTQTLAAANLFHTSDADGDTITKYAFWDIEGHGYWTMDGVTQPTNAEIDVSAADLSRLNYVAGFGTDRLYVRAYDGITWGTWTEFNATGALGLIAPGDTVELGSATSAAVIFGGSTGTLRLDDPSSFAGTVAGLTGSDAIDFANIGFGSVQTPTFSGSAADGMLTMTDGVHTDQVKLIGDYQASMFATASDGHGGTLASLR